MRFSARNNVPVGGLGNLAPIEELEADGGGTAEVTVVRCRRGDADGPVERVTGRGAVASLTIMGDPMAWGIHLGQAEVAVVSVV